MLLDSFEGSTIPQPNVLIESSTLSDVIEIPADEGNDINVNQALAEEEAELSPTTKDIYLPVIIR